MKFHILYSFIAIVLSSCAVTSVTSVDGENPHYYKTSNGALIHKGIGDGIMIPMTWSGSVDSDGFAEGKGFIKYPATPGMGYHGSACKELKWEGVMSKGIPVGKWALDLVGSYADKEIAKVKFDGFNVYGGKWHPIGKTSKYNYKGDIINGWKWDSNNNRWEKIDLNYLPPKTGSFNMYADTYNIKYYDKNMNLIQGMSKEIGVVSYGLGVVSETKNGVKTVYKKWYPELKTYIDNNPQSLAIANENVRQRRGSNTTTFDRIAKVMQTERFQKDTRDLSNILEGRTSGGMYNEKKTNTKHKDRQNMKKVYR